MEITKHVPLGLALAILAENGYEEFSAPTWAPFITQTQISLSHDTTLSLEKTKQVAALAKANSDPGVQLFASTLTLLADITEADAYRDYDTVSGVDYDLYSPFSSLGNDIASASPLLAPVAEVVSSLIPITLVSLERAWDIVDLVTEEGIWVEAHYTNEENDIEGLSIPWAQVDFIYPDTSTKVLALAEVVKADLPTYEFSTDVTRVPHFTILADIWR